MDETGKKIRQLKQALMRNESDLSDMDLDSLKVELTQVEDMIAKEESKVNMTEVSVRWFLFFFNTDICVYSFS